VRELVKKACVKLRAAQLPPPWAEGLPRSHPVAPPKRRDCRFDGALGPRHPRIPAQASLAYSIAGLAGAHRHGGLQRAVTKATKTLADYAATLSQAQLRALKFRLHLARAGALSPSAPVFNSVLTGVKRPRDWSGYCSCWQEQVLGPVQDKLVVIEPGKGPSALPMWNRSARVSGKWPLAGFNAGQRSSNENSAGREHWPSWTW